MTLGSLSIDVMDYLDNRFNSIEKKIDDLHSRLDPNDEDDSYINDFREQR